MRWNLLLLLILPFFFSACASKRHASRGKSPVGQSGRPDPGNRDDAAGRGRKDNTARTPSRSLDTEEYIRIYSSLAIEEMQRSGIPARDRKSKRLNSSH